MCRKQIASNIHAVLNYTQKVAACDVHLTMDNNIFSEIDESICEEKADEEIKRFWRLLLSFIGD
jgi:hypothetical protein